MLNNKRINRLFTMLIILFFATPFLIVGYGQFQGSLVGSNIQTMLEENIYFNLMFIMGFITPFIGLYMFHLKKELENNGDAEKILINLSFITLGYLIMGNSGYALFTAILIYFMLKHSKIRFSNLFKNIQQRKLNIKSQLPLIVFLTIAVLLRIALIRTNAGM